MKSVVMFVLLFACLFALAQWAQNLDLSCFWGEPAEASPQNDQTVEPISSEEADLLDWIDRRISDNRPSSGRTIFSD